jgi:hypothetical protein
MIVRKLNSRRPVFHLAPDGIALCGAVGPWFKSPIVSNMQSFTCKRCEAALHKALKILNERTLSICSR